MTRIDLESPEMSSVLRCGLAILGVCALYSGLAQYWESAYAGPRPLYPILVLVAGSITILAVEPRRPTRALRSPLLVWAYLYLLMSTGWGIWRKAFSPDTDQALTDRFRSVAFLLAMAVIFDDRRARTMGRMAVVLVAVISSFVNIGEALGAITFNDALRRTAGRAAGLYVNPNGSSLVIVFGLAAGIAVVPRLLRVPVLLIGACGVAATFSRGSLGCLAVLVLVLLYQKEVGVASTALATVGVVAGLAFQGRFLHEVLDVGGALNGDTLGRIAMTADDSGRWLAASRAWDLFVDSPWVGHGVAVEQQGRIAHNMYLSLAAEHGMLGLLTYPGLIFALLLRNRPALGMAAVCLVAGLTSHNLLEGEPSLLCFALAASQPLSPLKRTVDQPTPALEPMPI